MAIRTLGEVLEHFQVSIPDRRINMEGMLAGTPKQCLDVLRNEWPDALSDPVDWYDDGRILAPRRPFRITWTGRMLASGDWGGCRA